MKLLFYYSYEKAYTDENGNIYISGNFPPEVWERYLSISEHLDVVLRDGGRIKREDAIKTKQIIDTQKINVILVPDLKKSLRSFLSLINRRNIKETQNKLIEDNDAVIIRVASEPMIRKCRIKKIPYVIEVVGCPWDAYWNYSLKGKIIAPLKYMYAKREIRLANWTLYVTSSFLQKRYPTNGETVACSNVSLERIDETILAKRLKKINTNLKDKIILGTAAKIDVRGKGHEFVIKALSYLKKEGKTNYEYQVVGSGDATFLERISRKYNVQDQLKIIGQVPHLKVFEWLESIDIYIQPSLQEGLPRAVIEAMSYAVPCIGTDVAGIPELISNDVLYHKKDYVSLANIILTMNTKRQNELAKRNFEESKKYNVEILAERRREFYNKFKKFYFGDSDD